ncbi:MAG: hypothetical protein WCQ32_02415 [bacterium]
MSQHINSVPKKISAVLTTNKLLEIANNGSITNYLIELRDSLGRLKKVGIQKTLIPLIGGFFPEKRIVPFEKITDLVSVSSK